MSRVQTLSARLLVDCRCELGEGIQWNDRLNRLFWTDIHGRCLLTCDADGDDLHTIQLPSRLTAFAFDANNRMLAAFEDGLFLAERWQMIAAMDTRLSLFEPTIPTTRYNDGRCDRAGRFIVGGMNEDALKPLSSLTQFDAGDVRTLKSQVGCSNSICFSPDGGAMYFTDTATSDIWVYDYDLTSGVIHNGRIFVGRDAADGFADGSCVDHRGNVWNARFNGFSVVAFSPAGEQTAMVQVPVPQVTCACFGGPELDRLFITTGREDFSDADAARFPDSGGVYVAMPGARGLRESLSADLSTQMDPQTATAARNHLPKGG